MLTDYGKELFGFKPMRPGESITARFHSLQVLSLGGIAISENAPAFVASGCVVDIAFSIAVGSSLNRSSQRLLNEDYAEDEAEWAQKRGCVAPYAIIHIGPTEERRCEGVYAQEIDGRLITYDGFTRLKSDLRMSASRVLPVVMTALTCALSSREHQVQPKLVDSVLFGQTVNGKRVEDVLFLGSATGTVVKTVEAETVIGGIQRALNIASSLREKVAQFYSAALAERDPLKRFLFFFLSIEVETHATASRIDSGDGLKAAIEREPRARALAEPVLKREGKHWKTLGDRMVLCAIFKWVDLSEAEVSELQRLRRVRHKIAHGEILAPSGRDVVSVERMATLLLKTM